MKPGNRTHNVKIIYDEVIPIEGDGLDGNTPLDTEKDCRLQIRRLERPPCQSPDENS